MNQDCRDTSTPLLCGVNAILALIMTLKNTNNKEMIFKGAVIIALSTINSYFTVYNALTQHQITHSEKTMTIAIGIINAIMATIILEQSYEDHNSNYFAIAILILSSANIIIAATTKSISKNSNEETTGPMDPTEASQLVP